MSERIGRKAGEWREREMVLSIGRSGQASDTHSSSSSAFPGSPAMAGKTRTGEGPCGAMREAVASAGLPPTLGEAIRLGVGREFVDVCKRGLETYRLAVGYVLARLESNRGE